METSVPEESANSQIRWILLACFCLGAFLRIYNFWEPNLSLDEYGSWWVVSGSTWTEVAERATKTQGQSPFYYLVVKLFTVRLGEGFFQLRLPSILFGISTLLIAYPLAIQIFHDRHVSLASVAVFSVSDHLIWFSQIARPYALALFLTLLSFLSFLHFLHSRRTLHGIGYALATALLIYSHFLFGFVVIIQVVAMTLRLGWRDALSKNWLLAFFLIAILCLPLSCQIVSLHGRRHTLDWIPHFSQSFQASEIARGFVDPWALVLATVALLTVGIKPIDLRDSRTREFLVFLSAWLVIPLAGIWTAAALLGVSFLESRYILFVYPAAFYLWAWLMVHLKPADWRRSLPTCVFVITIFSVSLIPNIVRTGVFRDSDQLGWDRAAQVLAKAGRPDDFVVIYTGFVEADLFAQTPQEAYLLSYVGWPLIAHLPRNHRFFLVSLPLLQNVRTDSYIKSVETQAAKHDRVWVIGPDKQRNYFNEEMITGFGFRPVHRYLSDAKIQVTLLVRPLGQARTG